MTPEIFAGKASPAHLAGPSPRIDITKFGQDGTKLVAPMGQCFSAKNPKKRVIRSMPHMISVYMSYWTWTIFLLQLERYSSIYVYNM